MLRISEDANANYLAKIVKLSNVRKHSNADRLQCVTIDGNNVITGLEAKDGDVVVYFPLECAINTEYLSFSNSFRDIDLNQIPDKEKKGMFEKHGRVKCISLRGEKSEGYIVPVDDVYKYTIEKPDCAYVAFSDFIVDTEFDMIGDVQICKKYIPKQSTTPGQGGESKEEKKSKVKLKDLMVDNQFKFHSETSHLKKNMHRFSPDDVISVTYKMHGSSCILSSVLIKRKLSRLERICKWLGAYIPEVQYGYIYSSGKPKSGLPKGIDGAYDNNRKIDRNLWSSFRLESKKSFVKEYSIANGFLLDDSRYREIFPIENNDAKVYCDLSYFEKFDEFKGFMKWILNKTHTGFYNTDIWKKAFDNNKEKLLKGISIYGELVGFTEDGAAIQKSYDYGCVEKESKLYVYRITYTNIDGKTIEFSWKQVKDYCDKFGLLYTPEFYYGKAKDLFPISTENHWHENFLMYLTDKFTDKDCYMCVNKVPEEGVVVKKDDTFGFEGFKLKSFKFLKKESEDLDAGILDIESAESANDE